MTFMYYTCHHNSGGAEGALAPPECPKISYQSQITSPMLLKFSYHAISTLQASKLLSRLQSKNQSYSVVKINMNSYHGRKVLLSKLYSIRGSAVVCCIIVLIQESSKMPPKFLVFFQRHLLDTKLCHIFFFEFDPGLA